MTRFLIAVAITAPLMLPAACSMFKFGEDAVQAQRQEQLTVGFVCENYGNGMKELANFVPRLDAKARKVVDQVRAAMAPCPRTDAQAANPQTLTQIATASMVRALGNLDTLLAIFR